ncbi:hypothetical protein A176_003150 [Myxococcus hansupus]|uniref:Uncharacterized protein n=1 Tax=Pseudomyxococcus hansupus TaxID=1297742 RepID=A0A0H4WX93_9BACT|nr:hypothetical protein A176_003150 [Myxococcus hansupus]
MGAAGGTGGKACAWAEPVAASRSTAQARRRVLGISGLRRRTR